MQPTREMGKDPDREPPFFFMKPADAVIDATGVIRYPMLTSELHHEIEMVVALKAGGTNVSPHDALDLVWVYGVGVDLTRRDIQAEAKKLSRPWHWAKGFDASAPCSAIHPVELVGHPDKGAVWPAVNGGGQTTWRPQGADLVHPGSHQLHLASGGPRA